MNTAAENFGAAAKPVDEKSAFKKHFLHLKDALRALTKNQQDLNEIEPELKGAFKKFLSSMGYELALGNFNILLEEKNGDKKYRNDGTVNWYHEFIPIITLLTLASQGKNDGGFDIEDLKEYGGLEVLISTHLRHDSKEDFKTIDQIRAEQQDIIKQAENTKYHDEQCHAIIDMIVTNIDLVSQKRKDEQDPKSPKEDVRVYTSRMVNDAQSNPIVFMCKQADIIHNLSTIWGSPKFTPAKKQATCDTREDMYGARYGFTEVAKARWPHFQSAITTLDNIMGFVLYPHFRYLENVDLHYKSWFDAPVGISRYVPRALKLSLIEPFNPVHLSLKRMATSVDIADTGKYDRLQTFMERVIKPGIEKYKSNFPYLFGSNDNKSPLPPKPVAAPQ